MHSSGSGYGEQVMQWRDWSQGNAMPQRQVTLPKHLRLKMQRQKVGMVGDEMILHPSKCACHPAMPTPCHMTDLDEQTTWTNRAAPIEKHH